MTIKEDKLLLIFQRLCRAYTLGDSTTITYDKSNQLMGAIIFTITEAISDGKLQVSIDDSDVNLLYSKGKVLLEEKFQNVLARYNTLMKTFKDYNNICLHDTVIKGLPYFFKWYDMRFNPKDYILTLDYPVARDLSAYEGLNRIDEYLRCIEVETVFLEGIRVDMVLKMLNEHVDNVEESVVNIVYVVLKKLIVNAIVRVNGGTNSMKLNAYEIVGKNEEIEYWVAKRNKEEILLEILLITDEISKKYNQNTDIVKDYLKLYLNDICFEIMSGIEI